MKKYDKEYQTQYGAEVVYLSNRGFRYTFVKTVNEVQTYKYTKSPELFKCLYEFYSGN